MPRHDPFIPVLVAAGPDYRPPAHEPPVFRDDWDELHAQCRAAVARREAAYPELIARGQIAADLAARDIASWQALAAEWHWIITGEGAPPAPETLPDRIAACELALERIEGEFARGRDTDHNFYQRHLVTALLWHLTRCRFGAPAVHFCARFNHSNGHPRLVVATTERSAD